MNTLRLAWRNLWRNRTRTVISLSAISLSLAFLLIVFAINDGGYQQLLAAAEKAAGGSVLVHGKGWWEQRGADQLVQLPQPVLEAAKKLPGARVVAPRVIVMGLLSSPRGNHGTELRGIEPEAENQIENLSRHLVEGTFLEPGTERPLVLGQGIVNDLGLKLGDRVVLTASDTQGEMIRALFRLSGILKGGKAINDGAAYTTVAEAQRALGLKEAVTQIGIAAKPGVESALLKQELQSHLTSAEGLELLTWQEAAPDLLELIEVDKKQGYVMGIVILLVVGFGVANTFLMSVMERTRELGLLAALGFTPARVARLIMAETAVMILFASVLGVALAFGVHSWLAQGGIDMREVVGQEMEFSGVTVEDYKLNSAFVFARWLGSWAMVAAVVCLSALYPAVRASRQEPVEAMRSYA